jgi:hypothetical protein
MPKPEPEPMAVAIGYQSVLPKGSDTWSLRKTLLKILPKEQEGTRCSRGFKITSGTHGLGVWHGAQSLHTHVPQCVTLIKLVLKELSMS